MNAQFDFTIEEMPADEAKILMDFIDLYARSHNWTIGGGYVMVDEKKEAGNVENA